MLRRRRGRSANGLSEDVSEGGTSLTRLYAELIGVVRDQISDQLASANTNDLISAGAIGAALALMATLLLLRSAAAPVLGWSWWLPFPVLALPIGIISIPLAPPTENRGFRGGPSVPRFLTAYSTPKVTLEEMLEGLGIDRTVCLGPELGDAPVSKDGQFQ
jgi:hypothetical protein